MPIPKEIIIVDDCSTDGTRAILEQLDRRQHPRLLPAGQPGQRRGPPRGLPARAPATSSSCRTPTWNTTRPSIPRLIQPILDNRADVVFGSRFIGESHRVLYFWHSVANKMLTMLSNMFTNLNLTDMETCYKVFRREVLQGIKLKSNRFGFEPEVTAKIAKKKNPAWRIYEVPISYSGRTYEEGKKIGLKDAFRPSSASCGTGWRIELELDRSLIRNERRLFMRPYSAGACSPALSCRLRPGAADQRHPDDATLHAVQFLDRRRRLCRRR